MILDAFRLTGKVAIVTGCDTGLGQGMALALAEAGCDIIGVNRKIPHETAAQVEALGRRFSLFRPISASKAPSSVSSPRAWKNSAALTYW